MRPTHPPMPNKHGGELHAWWWPASCMDIDLDHRLVVHKNKEKNESLTMKEKSSCKKAGGNRKQGQSFVVHAFAQQSNDSN